MSMTECYESHRREGCAGSHEMVTVTPIHSKTGHPKGKTAKVLAMRDLDSRRRRGLGDPVGGECLGPSECCRWWFIVACLISDQWRPKLRAGGPCGTSSAIALTRDRNDVRESCCSTPAGALADKCKRRSPLRTARDSASSGPTKMHSWRCTRGASIAASGPQASTYILRLRFERDGH
jgi:hypothetical protein